MKKQLPDISHSYQLQKARDLLDMVTGIDNHVSAEDLMNKAGEFYQKIKEALVASPFAAGFALLVKPVLIKMAHGQMLDFELHSMGGQKYEFEIVMSIEPDRKPGLEYRNGSRPITPRRAFSGEQFPPEWITKDLWKKTEMAKEGQVSHRHLLIYQNIAGGLPDLGRLRSLCAGAESVWASVWLISGVPDMGWIALLFNRDGFACPEAKWFSYVNAPKGDKYGGVDLYLQ